MLYAGIPMSEEIGQEGTNTNGSVVRGRLGYERSSSNLHLGAECQPNCSDCRCLWCRNTDVVVWDPLL